MEIRADKDVDARYEFLRSKHGDVNPQANGYRLQSFFKREQDLLLKTLDDTNSPFLDIACGSGLMLSPLLDKGHTVYGLDYNAQACVAAAVNNIQIIRGDAFNLPIPDETIGQIVNCQFLNQQPSDQARRFVHESARVLKKDGRLIILWRNASSLMHKTAHAVFTMKDCFTGQPPFPQYLHTMDDIKNYGQEAGLSVEKERVTLPFLKPPAISAKHLLANIIGASLFIVLRKS